ARRLLEKDRDARREIVMDWAGLKALRETFLSEKPSASGDYWESPEQLEAYDSTFGARIGWKWDAVLRELKGRGWHPEEAVSVVDWGCGTGIASRRFLDAFGEYPVHLFDRSRLAVKFAADKIPGAIALSASPLSDFILLVSHVLNELPIHAEKALLTLVER